MIIRLCRAAALFRGTFVAGWRRRKPQALRRRPTRYGEFLEARQVLSTVAMTAQEQLQFELVNQAPTAGPDTNTVREDAAANQVSGNVLSNDGDPDGDALT